MTLAQLFFVSGFLILVTAAVIVVLMMWRERSERRADREERRADREELRADRVERRAFMTAVLGMVESGRERSKDAVKQVETLKEDVKRELTVAKMEMKEEVKQQGGGTSPHQTLSIVIAIFILGSFASVAANSHTVLPYPTMEGPIVAKKKPHKELEDAVQVAWRGGNYLAAVEAANALTAADPHSGLAYHVRGLAYEQSGDLDEAKKSYATAASFRFQPSINRLVRLGLNSFDHTEPTTP